MLPHRPTLVGLVLAVVAFCAAPPLALYRHSPTLAWILSLAAAVWAFRAIAAATDARVLTDERGRWSLSRLQLVAWSVLVLSTFWTMSVARMIAHAADPVALGVDNNLWLLLGISGTSFVASPLILGRKEASSPGIVDAPRSQGSGAPGVRDLFRGEDAGNAGVLDIGRVQMVFFTFVCLCTYAVACSQVIATSPPATVVFPPVSADLVALLGISHATYLVNKNVDRPERPTRTPRPVAAPQIAEAGSQKQ